jgi:hypothetical protein
MSIHREDRGVLLKAGLYSPRGLLSVRIRREVLCYRHIGPYCAEIFSGLRARSHPS